MTTRQWLQARAKSRVRWIFSRWPLAEVLNKSTRACWADLVTWALDGEIEGGPLGGGDYCREESKVRLDHACYCGKFTNGCLTRKGQMPGDVA